MKKLFFLVLVLIAMLFGITSVFAQEKEQKELLFKMEELSDLPPMYIKSDIELFSDENEKEKALAERLIEGWTNIAKSIDVEDLGIYTDDVSASGEDLYRKILFDNPLFYYVVSNRFGVNYYSSTGQIIEIAPVYSQTDGKEIAQTLEKINHATADILLQIDDSMNDFQKVMAVHDYMVLHYEYDTSLTKNTIKIMTEKIGVCQAYALAFKHVMDVLGIDSTFVPSNAMEHAWNLVKVDGKWYHIDLTWDDPVTDRYAVVSHEYALYSSEAFKGHENPHIGFDVGDLANSSVYDDAPWHSGTAGIVSWNGYSYWIEGNQLVRDDGKVIYDKLDGGDNFWHLGNIDFVSSVYTGLAEYDDSIYFNTDDGIYAYDPQTEEITLVLREVGICGLFDSNHTLKYCKYDPESNLFYAAGSIELKKNETPIEVGTIHKDDKVIISVNNETEKPILILSFGRKGAHVSKVPAGDTSSVIFEAEEEQTLFFWDFNMRPIRKPKVIYK